MVSVKFTGVSLLLQSSKEVGQGGRYTPRATIAQVQECVAGGVSTKEAQF